MSGSPPVAEWEHPLCLIDSQDPLAYCQWQHAVGAEESSRLMEEACLRHMEQYGTRAILDVTEALSDLTAVLSEYDDADPEEES